MSDSPSALLTLSDERDAALQLRHAAYREGYLDGGRDQWDAGYAAAIGDMKRTEHELVDSIRLTSRRFAPGGAAWLAAVAAHGLTEYGGAGRPRVPVAPEVIAQACREQRGRAA